MAAYAYSEDTLVQQTMADYLRDVLGWETVFAYNQETFGPEGTLGRASDREVVLTRYLQVKLMEFNPGLPADAYRDAVRQIVESSAAQSLVATNRDKYALLKRPIQSERLSAPASSSPNNRSREVKASCCDIELLGDRGRG